MATLAPPAPAWTGYAAGSQIAHFAWWCEEHCVQTIDQFQGLPLILEDWQQDFMGEVLAVTEEGHPFWRIAVLVVPRKNGKTTMVSAYGAYHVDIEDGRPRVQFCASSDDQAAELFDSSIAFIRESPYLSSRFHIRDYIGEIARTDGRGVIERMTAEWRRAHGPNPSRVVVDELHTWTTRGHVRFWNGLTTGDAARRNFQILVITTPGEAADRESSILGRLLDANEDETRNEVIHPTPGLTISRNFRSRTVVYDYSAPIDAKRHTKPRDLRDDVKAVKLANPASWVTEEFLAAKAADDSLEDAAFLQLHAGVWAEGEDVYIRAEDWKQLGDGAPVTPGRVVCLGADGSRTHDTTVVAWASPAPDGRIDVDAWIFSVRRVAPHHELHRGRIDYNRVEDFLEQCFEDYEVLEAAYDPRYLERSADILTDRLDEDVIAAVEPTSRLMRDALAAFHRGVIDGRVRHRGDRAILEHIRACKGSVDERGWVVRKREHGRPIDAVIAMALAYWRADLTDGVDDGGFESADDHDLDVDDDPYPDLYDDSDLEDDD